MLRLLTWYSLIQTQ